MGEGATQDGKTENLRLVWATQDPVSKEENKVQE